MAAEESDRLQSDTVGEIRGGAGIDGDAQSQAAFNRSVTGLYRGYHPHMTAVRTLPACTALLCGCMKPCGSAVCTGTCTYPP